MEALSWNYEDITLTGYSLAGISTSIGFPLADVCFDVAQGLPFQIPFNNILLTHGHMDHASGIPYLIGQKAMRGSGRPQIYMPPELLTPMNELMKIWSGIENHTYKYDFHAVVPGDERPLKGPFYFRPFPTFHRVPSQGYTVFRRKKRLLSQYRGLGHVALGDLRRAGKVIEEKYEEAAVSFTGDTKIEFCDSPQVRASKVLVMEATYWDAERPIASAREWGHLHIEELIPRLDDLPCEKIVLIHTSARYSTSELRAILAARIPEKHRSRVELFPRPN